MRRSALAKLSREAIRHQFQGRYPLLKEAAKCLEEKTSELLSSVRHIDRVYFRAKDPDSFADKACQIDKKARKLKYGSPFNEIEDQVAGRVLVFFLSDIEIVKQRLLEHFNRVEAKMKQPNEPNRFDYESQHFVFTVPIDVRTDAWRNFADMPETFEMQVRTLFMHAWAEPQHDLEYKATRELTNHEKRQLAWAAASAWGADQAIEQVHRHVDERDE